MLAGSVVPTREIVFLSWEVQTEASQSLGGVAAVRLHTFSLDWTPQSSCSDGWSGTFSHGPIHLSFLADPLCPSPFFQLPLHPPQAAQQPSLVSQCSQVDLGREAPSCGVSQAEGEEHNLGKSSSRFIPATCRMFPEGSATERGGDRRSLSLTLPLVSWCILSTTGKHQNGLLGRAG